MKIVSWNCNGALRKKTQEVDKLDADIIIIQECEDPALSTKDYQNWAGDYLWVGDSNHKEICVFPKNNNEVKRLDWYGEFEIEGLSSHSSSIKWTTYDLKLFLPCKVNESFNILGVWTKGTDSEVFGYIGQFWKFLQIHKKNLSTSRQIIIGDFNSNKIWDKADRWWNHSDVVCELNDIGLISLFHHQHVENQGKESIPTFFMHRKKEKSYHIDYAFISTDFVNSSNIEIGGKESWLSLSDHMPISVTLNS
ncbi:MAG: hypothetical protein MRK01_14360 [Candidatus Scalindua sp.]|nr:hypothetical protein [Candidatus Scalindua sp.]